MRKVLTLFILSIIILACKNETDNLVSISGIIKNPMMNAMVINGQHINKTINLNADGSFAETLPIETNGYFTLTYGNKNSLLYLKQGGELKISFDADSFNSSIAFNGNGANENNYLVAKSKFNEDNAIDYQILFNMEPSEFFQTINKLKTKTDDFLNKATNIDADFKALEKNNNYFDYLVKLQVYPSYHEYVSMDEEIQLPEAFKKPFEDFDYENEAYYLNFNNYRQIVLNYYTEAIYNNNITTLLSELEKLDAPEMKNDIAKSLSKNIELAYDNNEALYNGIIAVSNDEAFNKKLTAQYNKIKSLSKGMPSPKFVNYENHKGGKTSLDDLKGTYLYIDIWATWCAPCINEIPFLKDLEKQYKGKNIEFVSISIDRPNAYETWFKMVTDKNLGGIQLIADSDWQSQFIKDYNIIGIPRFLIIDPDGNIVSADATRPSDPKLIDLLNSIIL